MGILEEIETRSKDISTDSYSMSVGELLSMYKDGELILRPEYQRLFRWTPEQKSRFIESILLGIPVPSIFVSQKKDGKWEVVDGLQRLSTLIEVSGELKVNDGTTAPALTLSRTKYLPSLENLNWNADVPERTLPNEAKLRIKRARIDVNILLNNSDSSAKYEMFQRLNTGGSTATDQEVRNAILLMLNPDFYNWMYQLSQKLEFRNCIPLTDKAIEEQFDLELVTRFIVLVNLSDTDLSQISELGTFLTEKVIEFSEDAFFDKEKTEKSFTRTFEALSRLLGENSFKKYDASRNQASGAMLISLFEVLAVGVGTFAGENGYVVPEAKIVEKHKNVSTELLFTSAAGSGIRASTRIPRTVGLGRTTFAP